MNIEIADKFHVRLATIEIARKTVRSVDQLSIIAWDEAHRAARE